MTDLLACPFCGGKAEWEEDGLSDMIGCKACPALMRVLALRRSDAKKTLIKSWNRRVQR